MKTAGIIQPNYIPWRGFFDFLHEVDVFIFLDDVQFTPRDWRNRNRIRTREGGSTWLTIPVLGGRNQLIRDVAIDNQQPWRQKHLQALRHNYSKAPFFEEYFAQFSNLLQQPWTDLCSLDVGLTRAIADWLGIETEFVVSSTLDTQGAKDEKLISISAKIGAERYLSGPAARAYIQSDLWNEAGIELAYKDYSGYPEYAQISEPFEPAVSILDLLFMKGPESPEYIWGKYRRTGIK